MQNQRIQAERDLSPETTWLLKRLLQYSEFAIIITVNFRLVVTTSV